MNRFKNITFEMLKRLHVLAVSGHWRISHLVFPKATRVFPGERETGLCKSLTPGVSIPAQFPMNGISQNCKGFNVSVSVNCLTRICLNSFMWEREKLENDFMGEFESELFRDEFSSWNVFVLRKRKMTKVAEMKDRRNWRRFNKEET